MLPSAQSSVSSELRNKLNDSGTLLGALDAITRWRPFALLVTAFVACGVISAVFGGAAAMLFQHSGVFSAIVGLLGTLVVGITALVGINGAGILLSDDVWERTQRGCKDALLASLFTSHRLILILLLEGLLFIGYLIVLAILLFVCKIPAIGPILYAVIFPFGAILSGVLLFGLVYVAIPLAAPAVWNGSGVMSTLAMIKEVVRHRLLLVAVMTLFLGLLLFVVGGIIAIVFGGGLIHAFGAISHHHRRLDGSRCAVRRSFRVRQKRRKLLVGAGLRYGNPVPHRDYSGRSGWPERGGDYPARCRQRTFAR